MPKSIEYPRASFKAAQELADAVNSLGGVCSVELSAEKIGNKIGGAFNNILNSAVKFQLVTHKGGQIATSSLYREIKLAYTDEERRELIIKSFLSPPIFLRLYERFKGKELPIGMLEKMLIKEYEVDDNIASRIKKYFLDGVKSVGLLDAQNKLAMSDVSSSLAVVESEELSNVQESNSNTVSSSQVISLSDLDEYTFHITGPGVNSRIAIREEEDFTILEAMIKKIKKRFDFSNQS